MADRESVDVITGSRVVVGGCGSWIMCCGCGEWSVDVVSGSHVVADIVGGVWMW